MNNDIFYQYNPWWELDFEFKNFIARPRLQKVLEQQISDKAITFVTGLRRTGKTTLLKSIINVLLQISRRYHL